MALPARRDGILRPLSAVFHIQQAIGSDIPPDLDVYEIINEAGRFLCSMHDWKWLEGRAAALDIINGVDYVELPDDFRELIAYEMSDGLAQTVEMVSLEELLALRTSSVVTNTWHTRAAITHKPKRLRNLIKRSENIVDGSTDAAVGSHDDTIDNSVGTISGWNGNTDWPDGVSFVEDTNNGPDNVSRYSFSANAWKFTGSASDNFRTHIDVNDVLGQRTLVAGRPYTFSAVVKMGTADMAMIGLMHNTNDNENFVKAEIDFLGAGHQRFANSTNLDGDGWEITRGSVLANKDLNNRGSFSADWLCGHNYLHSDYSVLDPVASFDDLSGWTVGQGVGVGDNWFTAPDGTNTAQRLYDTLYGDTPVGMGYAVAKVNPDGTIVGSDYPLIDGNKYTCSVFLKRGQYEEYASDIKFKVWPYGTRDASGELTDYDYMSSVLVDAVNGTVTIDDDAEMGGVDPEIVDVGNGWYKVSIIWNCSRDTWGGVGGNADADYIRFEVQPSYPSSATEGKADCFVWMPGMTYTGDNTADPHIGETTIYQDVTMDQNLVIGDYFEFTVCVKKDPSAIGWSRGTGYLLNTDYGSNDGTVLERLSWYFRASDGAYTTFADQGGGDGDETQGSITPSVNDISVEELVVGDESWWKYKLILRYQGPGSSYGNPTTANRFRHRVHPGRGGTALGTAPVGYGDDDHTISHQGFQKLTISYMSLRRIDKDGMVRKIADVPGESSVGVEVVDGLRAVGPTGSWRRVWCTMVYNPELAGMDEGLQAAIWPNAGVPSNTTDMDVDEYTLFSEIMFNEGVRPLPYEPTYMHTWDDPSRDPGLETAPMEPAPVLELYPAPTATDLGGLTVHYRGDWERVYTEMDTIRMPKWLGSLYIQILRAFAANHVAAGAGTLNEDLMRVAAGPLFISAVDRDGWEQPIYGSLRNGGAQEASYRAATGFHNFTGITGPV